MKLSRVVLAALLSMSFNASADVWYVDKDNTSGRRRWDVLGHYINCEPSTRRKA